MTQGPDQSLVTSGLFTTLGMGGLEFFAQLSFSPALPPSDGRQLLFVLTDRFDRGTILCRRIWIP